mgnify:CR=1 FL=1
MYISTVDLINVEYQSTLEINVCNIPASCFFANLSVVEPMIFKSDDIDFLLSIGYTDKEIISADGYIADTQTTKYLLSISTSEDFYDYLNKNVNWIIKKYN